MIAIDLSYRVLRHTYAQRNIRVKRKGNNIYPSDKLHWQITENYNKQGIKTLWGLLCRTMSCEIQIVSFLWSFISSIMHWWSTFEAMEATQKMLYVLFCPRTQYHIVLIWSVYVPPHEYYGMNSQMTTTSCKISAFLVQTSHESDPHLSYTLQGRDKLSPPNILDLSLRREIFKMNSTHSYDVLKERIRGHDNH